ncbi:hypothetical protein GCM10023350_29610 [Nocardioides endophyticus]|uniref:Flavodoxin-like fold domain-containing protein n=1 Tax=Nocardioides endophyticus TaxID=1353775 RepID=A0ABP8Z073_9ACTN
MHLLTVFSHPFRDSYVGAVMDRFHEPFVELGHSVDLLDLQAEGFDPRFSQTDHEHYFRGGPIDAGVAQMQRRVEAADRLALVFPVYWWSMPALMKGWVERVFTGGWAHRRAASEPGLLPVPTLILGVAGSTERSYAKYGYREAMRAQLDMGVFSYCRLDDVETRLIFDVESERNTEQREAGLVLAHEIGAGFAAPDREPRRARAEYFAARERPGEHTRADEGLGLAQSMSTSD